MREKEITGRLKDLSQQAQEWNFPQAVEQGDWLYDFKYEGVVLVDKVSCHIGAVGALDDYEAVYDDASEYFLILEFRHCLSWLREKGWELQNLLQGVHPSEGQYFIQIAQNPFEGRKLEHAKGDFLDAFGPTIDEAAAEVTNKVLKLEAK